MFGESIHLNTFILVLLLITLAFFFTLPQTTCCDYSLCWGGWKHSSLWIIIIIIIILLDVQNWIAREFKVPTTLSGMLFSNFKCVEPLLQLRHMKLQLHWNFITKLTLLFSNFYFHCNLSMLLCLTKTQFWKIILVLLYKQN